MLVWPWNKLMAACQKDGWMDDGGICACCIFPSQFFFLKPKASGQWRSLNWFILTKKQLKFTSINSEMKKNTHDKCWGQFVLFSRLDSWIWLRNSCHCNWLWMAVDCNCQFYIVVIHPVPTVYKTYDTILLFFNLAQSISPLSMGPWHLVKAEIKQNICILCQNEHRSSRPWRWLSVQLFK